MNKKKYSLVPLLSVIVLLAVVSFVRAEDDESEDDGGSSSSTSKTTKTVTQTIVLEPAKTVITTIMKNFELPDSDRDGIPDEQDLYPEIPQQLMVSDANFDGIDDDYEIQNQ
jgi:hypothetical protein